MQIVCPDCAARYQIPDERIVPGSRVRCARCTTTWVPAAPVAPVALAPVSEPIEPDIVSEAAQRDAPPPTREPAGELGAPARDRLAAFAWIATLVVLAALAVAAWRYRPQIEHAWPPSQRVYDLL